MNMHTYVTVTSSMGDTGRRVAQRAMMLTRNQVLCRRVNNSANRSALDRSSISRVWRSERADDTTLNESDHFGLCRCGVQPLVLGLYSEPAGVDIEDLAQRPFRRGWMSLDLVGLFALRCIFPGFLCPIVFLL